MVSAALDMVERQAEGTDFHTGQRLAAPCKKVFFIVFFQLLKMDVRFVLFQYFKSMNHGRGAAEGAFRRVVRADLKTAAAHQALSRIILKGAVALFRIAVFFRKPDLHFFQPGKNFFPIYAKVADDGEFGKGRQFYFSFLHDIAEEEGACQTGKSVDEHGAGAAFLFLTAGGVIDFFCFFSVSGKKRHAGIQFG